MILKGSHPATACDVCHIRQGTVPYDNTFLLWFMFRCWLLLKCITKWVTESEICRINTTNTKPRWTLFPSISFADSYQTSEKIQLIFILPSWSSKLSTLKSMGLLGPAWCKLF